MKKIPKNRLAELRYRSRLTIEEVSTLTGLSDTVVSRHELGLQNLSRRAIVSYSKLFKVSIPALYYKFPVDEVDEGIGRWRKNSSTKGETQT